MFSDIVIIPNQTGLHARPASDLANLCKQYQSEILIACGDRMVNAKSVIGILSGGIKQKMEVEIRVTGEDEDIAGPEIVAFIRNLK